MTTQSGQQFQKIVMIGALKQSKRYSADWIVCCLDSRRAGRVRRSANMKRNWDTIADFKLSHYLNKRYVGMGVVVLVMLLVVGCESEGDCAGFAAGW